MDHRFLIENLNVSSFFMYNCLNLIPHLTWYQDNSSKWMYILHFIYREQALSRPSWTCHQSWPECMLIESCYSGLWGYYDSQLCIEDAPLFVYAYSVFTFTILQLYFSLEHECSNQYGRSCVFCTTWHFRSGSGRKVWVSTINIHCREKEIDCIEHQNVRSKVTFNM